MANELIYQSIFQGKQIDARLTAVASLQEALAAVEQAIMAKYTKPASGIPETDMDAAVQSALAKARSAVQDPSDYYTKTEIDALLAAVNSQQYVDVTALPTASTDTLGKIYLVGPDANNQYARYYTSYDGSVYSWVAAGTTEINLALYATKEGLSQLGQDLAAVKSMLGGSFRLALVNALRHIAFIDGNGAAYISTIETSLSGLPINVISIAATYTQQNTVYPFTDLNDLKADLVVVGTLEDSSTMVLPAEEYVLSGSLNVGTSSIVVSYGNLTATFDVTVTQGARLRLTDGDIFVNNSAVAFVKAQGDISFSTTGAGANGKRNAAVSAYKVGVKHLVTTNDNINYTETDRYPIPVPSWATQIILSAVNVSNNIQTGPSFYDYDPDSNMYIPVLDPGWGTGERAFTFTAGQCKYMTIALRLVSGAVADYPATEITILLI